jgi:hypothetical protein
MRKALIAVIVAAALFAVGALAASFTVNSEDVASGSDPVTACASNVDVDFTTVYDGESDWNVGSAVVRFYSSNVSTALTNACSGFGATVAVELTGGGQVLGEALVAGNSATVPLDSSVKASQIIRASVLVDGKELVDDTPGGGDADAGITAPSS